MSAKTPQNADPPLDVTPEQWQIVRRILRELAPAVRVWAFGSRATGEAKTYSDLDIALVDETSDVDRRVSLAEAFSLSDLPWKVDIVEWATTSPRFRAIIERDKVELQSGVAGDV